MCFVLFCLNSLWIKNLLLVWNNILEIKIDFKLIKAIVQRRVYHGLCIYSAMFKLFLNLFYLNYNNFTLPYQEKV